MMTMGIEIGRRPVSQQIVDSDHHVQARSPSQGSALPVSPQKAFQGIDNSPITEMARRLWSLFNNGLLPQESTHVPQPISHWCLKFEK
jgi:hypothetical protein